MPTSPRTATRPDGRAYGVDESRRSSSPLQLAIANRCLIVLSLLDQRADFPDPTMRLSLTVIAEGINQFVDRQSIQSHSTISRLLRAHRRWTPDLIAALCDWADDAFGLAVDPGWVTYGTATQAPAPEIPLDCELRPGCTLSDADFAQGANAARKAVSKRPRRKGR